MAAVFGFLVEMAAMSVFDRLSMLASNVEQMNEMKIATKAISKIVTMGTNLLPMQTDFETRK